MAKVLGALAEADAKEVRERNGPLAAEHEPEVRGAPEPEREPHAPPIGRNSEAVATASS